MGFRFGLKNFGSKILESITKAADWVAPTFNKVLGTLAAPVSMIHPAIGSAMEVGAKLAAQMEQTVRKDGKDEFIKNTYNGIEIIIHKSDGYVIASKMVMIIKQNFWASPKYASIVGEIMYSINENSQQTHTNFEANINRLIEQLQRENTDYSKTIQQIESRLVPQDKQYDYMYSVELINEDIDGNVYQSCHQRYVK
ncbi:MAG: hypothetical protein EZS28_003961 [Streblomastix strix]|uniref:Uncharacterized protein n=1 Tax=Streblomastix strix TaxID=222440 RepID=A0A5J4X1J6_9EUKA|nr:MAG: hypothetical protein EZS28_003961 [Streblomastix strix]